MSKISAITKKYDVIIVGSGIFGAAIFYYLSKRLKNKSIALIERNDFCCGATKSSLGFVRLFNNSLEINKLALESFYEFQNLEKLTGYPCNIEYLPFLTIANYSSNELATIKQQIDILSHNPYGIDIKIDCLDAQAAASNYNGINFNNGEICFVENTAARLNPEQATMAYIKAAVKLGGSTYSHTYVQRINTKNNTITGINTSSGVFDSSCVIVAAGYGTKALLDRSNIICDYLESNKIIQISYYTNPDNTLIPSYIDKVTKTYGCSINNNICAFASMEDRPVSFSEDNLPIVPELGAIKTTEQQVKLRFPWMNHNLWIGGYCAQEAFTENNLGVYAQAPKTKGLFLCCGWSGIGFKVAPAVAKRMVDMVVNSYE